MDAELEKHIRDMLKYQSLSIIKPRTVEILLNEIDCLREQLETTRCELRQLQREELSREMKQDVELVRKIIRSE